MGEQGKTGKTSGVTGADVAAAPDVATLAPGKRNLVQSVKLGSRWICQISSINGNLLRCQHADPGPACIA